MIGPGLTMRLASLMPVWAFSGFALWQAAAHLATAEPVATDPRPVVTRSAEPDAGHDDALPSLDALRDRPLFSETRRPFVPAPEPEPEPEPEIVPEPDPYPAEPDPYEIVIENPVDPDPVYTLVGIMVRNRQATALVQNTETGETMPMRQGMEIGGWNLDGIDTTEVSVSSGRRSARIAVGDVLPEKN